MQAHISGVIESQLSVQRRDGIQLLLIQIEICNLEILLQPLVIVALGNDGQSSLRCPSQQDLCWGTFVLLGDLGHDRVLEENGGVLRLLPFELDEGLWAEGRVGGYGYAFGFGELEKSGLHKVGVVLDLEGCGADF